MKTYTTPHLFTPAETIYFNGQEIGEIEPEGDEWKATSITGLQAIAGSRQTALKYLTDIFSRTKQTQAKLF